LEKLLFSAIEWRKASDVRQVEVQTAQQLVHVSHRLKFEMAIAKLRKYKTPGSNQILGELILAEGDTLLFTIHKLINYIWNKKELPISGRSPIFDKMRLIIIVGYHRYQLHTKFYQISSQVSRLGGSPCHHSMARPRIVDGRDGLQLEVSCEYIEYAATYK
jgi:hypothetical protein